MRRAAWRFTLGGPTQGRRGSRGAPWRLSLLEAIRRYDVAVEEFLAWERALDRVHGLRVTRLQIYGDKVRDDRAENDVPKAGFIEAMLRVRRPMEEALGDLVVKYESQRTPDLARMIRQLEIEYAVRSGCEFGCSAAAAA